MKDSQHVAVIDIGKTNVKLVLINVQNMSEVAVLAQPNSVQVGQPYPHYDIESIWNFITVGLAKLQQQKTITAITVTAHGASAALLDSDRNLAAPILDYEHNGPDSIATQYDAARPSFQETGSPRLPLGLNLGAQIYWLFETFPEIKAATKHILTYPQYWVARLTGIMRNEVTSLGCHTDLWCPQVGCYSSMVDKLGWLPIMAPICQSNERIGPILPAIAAQTGLGNDTSVYGGIHDSNASLYPHLQNRKAPFAVVSTGTWVVCMAIGGNPITLDPARDTLINVNGFGQPVPSSRFMGGREFETLMEGQSHPYQQYEVDRVLDKRLMLKPSVEIDSGPFQGQKYQWVEGQECLSKGERFVAVSFYLALMTATCLDLIGAAGEIVVEGPFSKNSQFCTMLSIATGRPVIPTSGTGTSVGAALLTVTNQTTEPIHASPMVAELPFYSDYAKRWLSMVDQLPT